VLQSIRAGCSTGPDPVITPLPRAAAVPEPTAVFLLATVLVAVPLARRNFRGQLRRRESELTNARRSL
jgi:hypothetical protein